MVTAIPQGVRKSRVRATNLLLTFSLYALLFGPKFTSGIDLTVLSAFLWATVTCVYICVKGTVNKDLLTFSTLNLILGLYASLVIAIVSYDSSLTGNFQLGFFKAIIYILAANGIYIAYQRLYNDTAPNKLIVDIFRCTVIVSLTVNIFAINLPLRQAAYSTVDLYIFKNTSDFDKINRISDLSIGGSTISLIFCMGIFLAIGSLLFKSHSFNSYLKILAAIVSLWISTLLTARTGFLLISPILLLLFVFAL